MTSIDRLRSITLVLLEAMSPSERVTQSVSILSLQFMFGSQNRKWVLLAGNNQCLHVRQQGHTEIVLGRFQE